LRATHTKQLNIAWYGYTLKIENKKNTGLGGDSQLGVVL